MFSVLLVFLIPGLDYVFYGVFEFTILYVSCFYLLRAAFECLENELECIFSDVMINLMSVITDVLNVVVSILVIVSIEW